MVEYTVSIEKAEIPTDKDEKWTEEDVINFWDAHCWSCENVGVFDNFPEAKACFENYKTWVNTTKDRVYGGWVLNAEVLILDERNWVDDCYDQCDLLETFAKGYEEG